MGRTLANLRRVDVGFDPSRMVVVNINAAGLAAPSTLVAYHARLNERLAALPGVERVTMAQMGPFASGFTVGPVEVPGFTPATDEDRIARVFFVGTNYFETLGMPMVAGRGLEPQDALGPSRATVVNEEFARFYFGSVANALDRTINRDVRIVGVVANARYNTLRDQPARATFYPRIQRPAMAHIVRTADDPGAVIRAVREAVVAHDPRLRPRISTAAELMTVSLARERFFAVIAWTLSALALILACAGLYAAVAYAVTQRQGELAVRLALGASPRDILSAVLRDPFVTTTIGIAAGMPGAYAVMRSAGSLLYGVSPFELSTVLLCGAALVLAGMLATAWPARRVLAIDPSRVLRNS
jgi:hypothetical protein